jgi:hypothetical protein
MEADVAGHQRKVVRSAVRPVKRAHGPSGIRSRAERTLPFVVTRGWNAPAGRYPEQFFIVQPDTREVLYESPVRNVLIWGLQSITDLADEVSLPLSLAPGTYEVVFALGGVMGGRMDVEVTELPAEEAA